MSMKVMPIIVCNPTSSILLVEKIAPDNKGTVWDLFDVVLPKQEFRDYSEFVNEFMGRLHSQLEFPYQVFINVYDRTDDFLTCLVQTNGQVCVKEGTDLHPNITAQYFEFCQVKKLRKSPRLEDFFKKYKSYDDMFKSVARTFH